MPAHAYRLNDVRQLAADYNGQLTWDFSQGIPLRFVKGVTGDGICLSLACHWIKHHARDDSLVNHLGGVWNPQQRTYLAFNQQEYRRLANWQRNLEQVRNWEAGYQGWFRNHQLEIHSSQEVGLSGAGLRTSLEKITGGYALIIVGKRAGSAHAIAVYVGGRGEDACFFDPNYGEIWFEDRTDFFFFLHLMLNFCYHRNHRTNHDYDQCKIVRIYRRN